MKEHWSPFFQQFRGDAPPPEVSPSFSPIVVVESLNEEIVRIKMDGIWKV